MAPAVTIRPIAANSNPKVAPPPWTPAATDGASASCALKYFASASKPAPRMPATANGMRSLPIRPVVGDSSADAKAARSGRDGSWRRSMWLPLRCGAVQASSFAASVYEKTARDVGVAVHLVMHVGKLPFNSTIVLWRAHRSDDVRPFDHRRYHRPARLGGLVVPIGDGGANRKQGKNPASRLRKPATPDAGICRGCVQGSYRPWRLDRIAQAMSAEILLGADF